MKTGADSVVESLKSQGVDTIFGLPGGAVLDIFAKLYHAPFQFILSRHEQGATHMADGYARATGRVGCCIVTSGPGATNTVTGLATAYMDGSPIVCITGQVPSSMIGNDAFQEADTTGITRPVTKHNYLVRSVHDIPSIIAKAFYIAKTGKPGPVVIDIPKDYQSAPTKATVPEHVELRGYKPSVEGHPKQIEKLAKAINNAKRPLLYTGGGVISSGASAELTELAHKAQIPVTSTLMGLGGFPGTDSLFLGMLGMHGSVAANRAVDECDLLIAVGARFDDRVTGKISEFAQHACKAHIDIDPTAIGKRVPIDIPVVGDIKNVLIRILELVSVHDRTEWLTKVTNWTKTHPFEYNYNNPKLLPEYVIEKIYELTKGEAIIVTDVGQHQMWSAQFYKYIHPRSFITSGGLGTMGFGLPAAVGAQAGMMGKLVINIAGDGSIQMNFQEMVVAVEHKFPVKVIVINNKCFGMVRQWQQMFYKGEYSVSRLSKSKRTSIERICCDGKEDTYLPDFVRLAEAHGAVGMRVTEKEKLVPTLEKAFAMSGPVLVECIVDEEENVFPMVPPGASLKEMIHRMV